MATSRRQGSSAPLFAQLERGRSGVEAHFTKSVRALRALHTKAKRRGWPDHTVAWFDGIVDFVELKKPKGSQFEALQPRTHEQLRKRGHNVYVLYTIAQVDEYIAMRAPHGRAVGVRI